MTNGDRFWELADRSDGQLLEGLRAALRTERRSLAELVAHLGEVEERRLHLQAACSSMFAYCVRLGMSEDEACRRIDLARLARRFPALFSELEGGRITISVALVLKPVLSPGNQLELLAAARGSSVEQARELVATRFPRPDAPSSVRKLPEGRVAPPPPVAAPATAAATAPAAAPVVAAATVSRTAAASATAATPAPAAAPPVAAAATASAAVATPATAAAPAAAALPPSATLAPAASPASRSRVEPLSAERYKVVFTADAELKRQLELARDLLRHAHPSGEDSFRCQPRCAPGGVRARWARLQLGRCTGRALRQPGVARARSPLPRRQGRRLRAP